MTQGFVSPKGAVALMALGVVIVGVALLLPDLLGHPTETTLTGAVLALLGVLWHMIARMRWKAARRR